MVSKELIEKARRLHGHICPFLVLGLRMSEMAMERLGVSRAGVVETIEEELIAVVEVNNCLVDGVQIATGCTFGNNSLIYLDLGKNAVVLFRRGRSRGIRVYIDSEKLRQKYFPEEAIKLFQKVVVERKGSKEEVEKLHILWEEIGYRMAEIPREEFVIQDVELIEDIEKAPIFKSVRCSKCGELVMETKALNIDGQILCYACSGLAIDAVIGRGIHKLRSIPYGIVGINATQ
ncbi:MAG: FmdE family protein [Ignisphaera sp.]|uniref:Formylmethanofuran dehydrogenase n=1 Tax=Ignisphaera aggregans TaxID=334771 RepID=A0A7J3JQW0_9CREN